MSDAAGQDRWLIELGDVTDPASEALLRRLVVELLERAAGEGASPSPDELEDGWDRLRRDDLAPPTGVFVVARRGGEDGPLVGCVGLLRQRGSDRGRSAELRHLYVRPAERGTGVAPGLLASAEEVARVWGARQVRAVVRDEQVEARSLLVRNGWRADPACGDGRLTLELG
ncbi:acetyltransferase (GNAT) family protein [Terracoccus luteus]|uniref:Acetyltransferase (GNAT) family protein n=1 Tax=Terracoccus luteus TaxID=53356 RepID=A0A495XY32_9MICO|nr:GNAT family N-acetyltransferase [Terracoccus luteus]RKT78842.1 acetyltransferase (GNAT) family protein [Terracoccus luteus]